MFESSFVKKFSIDDETLTKIKSDDIELLKFGDRWLRFALFGENTMTVDGAVLATKRSELKAKKKI